MSQKLTREDGRCSLCIHIAKVISIYQTGKNKVIGDADGLA